MMNHAKVIAAIGAILCPPAAAGSPPAPAQPGAASEKEVKDFLRWLYRHRPRKKLPPLHKKIPKDFLPERFRRRLPAIGRRILKDLMRGPRSPRKPGRGSAKPPRKRRPSKRSRQK